MTVDSKPICGVIRPIAQMGEYTAQHWSDVASILDEAITEAGFEPRLVSDADAIGVIQGRIVQNLYSDPIAVCDVSGKNPNVMFELGMRLAFDRPIVVIKDDLTNYSFDTSPIEHLTYPSTLHYSSILEFKDKLIKKLKATHDGKGTGKSFLQHFGPIKVAELQKENVPAYELIQDELRELKHLIRWTTEERYRVTRGNVNRAISAIDYSIRLDLDNIDKARYGQILTDIKNLMTVKSADIINDGTKYVLIAAPNSLLGYDDSDALIEIEVVLRAYRRKAKPTAKT